MNNNYHTQMNKQNLLNEIAANKHLLQQPTQNFQETNIRNDDSNVSFGSKVTSHQNILPNQMLPNQYYPNQAFPNPILQYQNPIQMVKNDEEIELSDNGKDKNKQSREIPEILDLNEHSVNQTNRNINIAKPDNDKKKRKKKRETIKYIQNSIPSTSINSMVQRRNKMIDYIVIPILLIPMFILLTHPFANKYFGKYLPEMKNFKGYIVRGVILAILYIMIRFISDLSTKKKN